MLYKHDKTYLLLLPCKTKVAPLDFQFSPVNYHSTLFHFLIYHLEDCTIGPFTAAVPNDSVSSHPNNNKISYHLLQIKKVGRFIQPLYCDCLQPTVHPLSKIWHSSSHVPPLMRHSTLLNEALTIVTVFREVSNRWQLNLVLTSWSHVTGCLIFITKPLTGLTIYRSRLEYVSLQVTVHHSSVTSLN
jgi:hypothetical protein